MSDLFATSSPVATRDYSDLPMPLELLVEDREVIRALSEYPEGDERNHYALEALKIGILALRHVGGQASADLIQREVRNMQLALQQHHQSVHGQVTATLKEYFDPHDGRFSERVQRLVGQDGELARLLKSQIDGENSQLARTLLAHVGRDSQLMRLLDPQQSEGLLATLRTSVEAQLSQQRDQVLKEFSLDNKEGSLSRLVNELTTNHGDLSKNLQTKIDAVVKEFSLNDETSALSRLVQNVTHAQRTITNEFSLDSETSCLSRLKRELMTILEAHVKTNAEFQEEVKGALRELTARREERDRSTLHGGTYQSAVFEFLRHDAEPRGDIADFVADRVGAIKNCKIGDVVVELGPDASAPGARIVVEAKEEQGYTLKQALEELAGARKNRTAQVGVFVISKKFAPENLRPIARFGADIVVQWDSEDSFTDTYLWSAIELARLICIRDQRQSASQAADFVAIESAILDIEKHAANLDDVQKHAETIQSASNKILKRVEIDRDAFRKQVAVLQEKIGDVKTSIIASE